MAGVMIGNSNPFATRFIKPGAVSYFFVDGESVESLVKRLCDQQWNGQIVGPHGSGKSTLLAALAPAVDAAGRKVVRKRVQAPKGYPGFGVQELEADLLQPGTQVIVDGFGELAWLARKKVKDACRRAGAGLLVTAHRDVGLPTLYSTQPSLELARAVVARLAPEGDATVTDDDVALAFTEAKGNVREMLFALFDVYRARTR
jgi:hypothetical protein